MLRYDLVVLFSNRCRGIISSKLTHVATKGEQIVHTIGVLGCPVGHDLQKKLGHDTQSGRCRRCCCVVVAGICKAAGVSNNDRKACRTNFLDAVGVLVEMLAWFLLRCFRVEMTLVALVVVAMG